MTNRTQLCLRFIALALAMACVGPLLGGCGDPGIVDKQYECDKDVDCQKTHACKNGKCVFDDNDKDGFAKNKDCNDNNKEVYPGAPEICDNGADDNCDGRTDETPCSCKDGTKQDCGSNKGICKLGQQTCNAGVWSKCEGAVDPTEEICDGKDNDCDGEIDEGVPNCCQPKETRPCGSQIGTCKQGVQNCQTGVWTECVGAVGPAAEECDGKDNDCDGKVDNTKDKTDPLQQSCFSGPPENKGKGGCKDGVQFCKAGKWSLCEKDVLPDKEVCDGVDNDCDGQVDNVKGEDKILERECYSADPSTKGKGVCKGGTQRCVGGNWSACLGEISPIAESCNGIDDDCDGNPDNTPGTTKPLGRACYSGPPTARQKGICQDGTQECVNGRWQGCQGDVLPEKELCDGKDNDCDGRTDNIPDKSDPMTEPCYTGPAGTEGKGTCVAGTKICQQGKFSACTGDVKPVPEICDNKDNDCNGQIDEGIAPQGTCQTTGLGECKAGQNQCSSGKTVCVAINTPKAELCDGKDNNCDGQIDENVVRLCGSTIGNCSQGAQACTNGVWGACIGGVKPTTETCNGKDDDCDGNIDENLSRSCGFNVGECKAGTQACINGTWDTCQGATPPSPEVCNGKDDNCDGNIDEGNPSGGGACSVPGLKGICVAGQIRCTGGKLVCTQVVNPANEVCNNQDDDCDGTTDEGASCNRGYQCSGGSCKVCSQPESKCSNFDAFCTKNAPSINCQCGFASYCYQQSASIFCSGCCAWRKCR